MAKAIATACALWLAACDGTGTVIYTAQLYDSSNACLASYTPISVVREDEIASTCPPACLLLGTSLYVSTMCPPLPDDATSVDPSDPGCAAALAAADAMVSCDNLGDAGAGEGGADEGGDEGSDEAGDLGASAAGDDGASDGSPVDLGNGDDPGLEAGVGSAEGSGGAPDAAEGGSAAPNAGAGASDAGETLR